MVALGESQRFQFISPGDKLFNTCDNLSTSVSIEQEYSEPESDTTTSPRLREVQYNSLFGQEE